MRRQLGQRAADAAGRSIAVVVAAIGRARRADKPMHPRGEVLAARLRRLGEAQTGAAFLDEVGEEDVLVRFSRSLGWPAPLPDVNGLAVRVATPDDPREHADVLMSTTGRGRLTRYLLVPTWRERSRFLGTLVPYRLPTGAVHLGARAVDEQTWHLVWARPRAARWTTYAVLTLTREPGRDLDLSFDAVTSAPTGLEVGQWHRRCVVPATRRRGRSVTSQGDARVTGPRRES